MDKANMSPSMAVILSPTASVKGIRMSQLVEGLSKFCEPKAGRGFGEYILRFRFEDEAVTTIRVVFEDKQSGAEMAITNMTTLPFLKTQQGFGTKALVALLDHVQACGLKHIQAVQVQQNSETFWEKKGFVKLKNITNDFRYESPSQ